MQDHERNSPHRLDVTMTAFNQITAILLKFILDNQTGSDPATRDDIAKHVGKTTAWVGKLLGRLEADPRGFLEKELKPVDGPGNPPYQYKLIRKKIVTYPLTAWITLALHEATRRENEIDRVSFETQVVTTLREREFSSANDLEDLVNTKLSALIALGDVVQAEYPPNHIYLDDTRFRRQKSYLELLAADLKTVR